MQKSTKNIAFIPSTHKVEHAVSGGKEICGNHKEAFLRCEVEKLGIWNKSYYQI